jgi:hypothetical protein
MRSFVFISFALDCIEKKASFLFSSMGSGEVVRSSIGAGGGEVVGGNAATVD